MSSAEISLEKDKEWSYRASLITRRLKFLLMILVFQTFFDISFEAFSHLIENELSENMQLVFWALVLVFILSLAVTYTAITAKLSKMFNGVAVTVVLSVLAIFHFLNVVPFIILYVQAKKEFSKSGSNLNIMRNK
jgi:hypothetical protein